jgi:hypothetical protein
MNRTSECFICGSIEDECGKCDAMLCQNDECPGSKHDCDTSAFNKFTDTLQ